MSSPTYKNIGSPGRTRTSDRAVNSRLLYQLSYRGIGRDPNAQAYSKCGGRLPPQMRAGCTVIHPRSAACPIARSAGGRCIRGRARLRTPATAQAGLREQIVSGSPRRRHASTGGLPLSGMRSAIRPAPRTMRRCQPFSSHSEFSASNARAQPADHSMAARTSSR